MFTYTESGNLHVHSINKKEIASLEDVFQPRLDSKTIIIIDDEAAVRDMLEKFLKRINNQNDYQFYDSSKRFMPNLKNIPLNAIVISDINMEFEGAGIEMVEKIHQLRKDLKLFFYSTPFNGQAKKIEEMIAAGIVIEHIDKTEIDKLKYLVLS